MIKMNYCVTQDRHPGEPGRDPDASYEVGHY